MRGARERTDTHMHTHVLHLPGNHDSERHRWDVSDNETFFFHYKGWCSFFSLAFWCLLWALEYVVPGFALNNFLHFSIRKQRWKCVFLPPNFGVFFVSTSCSDFGSKLCSAGHKIGETWGVKLDSWTRGPEICFWEFPSQFFLRKIEEAEEGSDLGSDVKCTVSLLSILFASTYTHLSIRTRITHSIFNILVPLFLIFRKRRRNCCILTILFEATLLWDIQSQEKIIP